MRAHVLSTNPGFNAHPNKRGRNGYRNSNPPRSSLIRELDDRRMAEEARERIGVPNESQWDKLQRLLVGPVMLLTGTRQERPCVTASMQLSEGFGNDYRPRDGIKLVLRGPDAHFPLKVNWDMVFVSSPGSACKDPRSTFFMQADLPESVHETLKGFTCEQLKVLLGFRGRRAPIELDVQVFGPPTGLW